MPDLTVIGLTGAPPTDPAAAELLAAATLAVGGARNLDLVAGLLGRDARRVVTGPLGPALDQLAAHEGPAVVLASGDPGWFGVLRALRERGLSPRVLPGVSSLAVLAARLGLPHDGVVTVSAHGRDARPALNAARALPAVAVLTGPSCTPADVGRAVDGWNRQLAVGVRLGHADEQVIRCTPAEAAAREWPEPNLVLVTDPDRAPRDHGPRRHDQPGAPPSGGWAKVEGGYAYRAGMVTKSEVRALLVARLAPTLGRLIWDVGAGSGSVGVECAGLGAAVLAVDRDRGACADIAANAAAHGVTVRVVQGEAPGVLASMPPADAAFIGGGGPGVVAGVAQRAVPRVVATFSSLDHAVGARSALLGAGYTVDGAQLTASRLADLPDGSVRLASLNPVIVLWADHPPEDGSRDG